MTLGTPPTSRFRNCTWRPSFRPMTRRSSRGAASPLKPRANAGCRAQHVVEERWDLAGA